MSVQVPKGYKQTEVGVIPGDWLVQPLEEFTSFISYGFTNPMPTVQSGVCMVTAKDINSGKINFDSARRTTLEAYEKLLTAKSRPKKDDILLTKDGTLGRLALVDDRVVCINQSVAVLRPNNKAHPLFLKLLLESPRYQEKMLQDAGGSTIKHIYITIVNLMPLAVPASRKEQQAIAEALSDADALIESLEQLIAKKRQIKQGTMQELLTGQRRLPGFSGEWIEKAFLELFDFSGGFSASREDLSLEGYCYLHYGDIHGSKKQYIDTLKDFSQIPKIQIDIKKISSKSLLKNGDVVFVDASEDDSGVSKHIVVRNEKDIPFISGLHTIVAKQKTNLLTREYLEYCFSNEIIHNQFIHYSVGTKVTGISKKNIAKIFIKFPPQDEQLAISEILSDIDEDINELLKRLDKARQIKQAMMQELLTGRIRLI